VIAASGSFAKDIGILPLKKNLFIIDINGGAREIMGIYSKD